MLNLTVLNAKQYGSLYPSEKFAYDNAELFAVQDWNKPHRAEITTRPATLEDAFAAAKKLRAQGGKPMVYAVGFRGEHREECFCFIPGDY